MQPVSTPPLPDTDRKALHTLEVLAFELFSGDYIREPENPISVPIAPETFRDSWQALGDEDRKFWRNYATMLSRDLQDAGISLRVSDAKELAKKVEFLLPSPPRAAYSLEP